MSTQVSLIMPSDRQEPHGSGYGHNHGAWMGMNPYMSSNQHANISPMHEYPAIDYGRHPPPVQTDTPYSIPRPPPYAASHPQMPPPLIIGGPSGIWPSMLTGSNTPGYQTPILPAAPIQTPVSATSTTESATPTSAKTASSRRKLTDDERRLMCLEAEQNPTMKQTQIGAKFNVERSTVSKILRQKEKYMNPPSKEETISAGKKSKARLPDFEKTLVNWVRNQQKKGLPVTDDELRKQAQVFSFSRSDQAVLSSSSWLDKFKQKNNLGPVTKIDGSNTFDMSLIDSNTASLLDTHLDDSSPSSNGLVSPPMSSIDEAAQGLAITDDRDPGYFNFDGKLMYSPSSELHDGMDHMLSEEDPSSLLSPISPEITRTDVNNGDMTLSNRLLIDPAVNSRQRSQTFPHLPEEVMYRPTSSAPTVPPIEARSAPAESRPTVDPRQMMKRHKSVPNIHDAEMARYSPMPPPPLPKQQSEFSPISNPMSPAEDDNIRALHHIKRLLQENPGVAEPDDYLAIGKLMEKLKTLRNNSTEFANKSPRLSKKRTILGIST